MRIMIQSILIAVCVVMTMTFITGCCCCMRNKTAGMTRSIHACADCHVLVVQPGKCPMCQKETARLHVLGVKDGNAMLCACPDCCQCVAAGIKDGKCACGKEVKTVSAKGLYVCPDGCQEITDKPGTCMCGKAMTKVE